jgi:predicted CXXCH cytochrome family protein
MFPAVDPRQHYSFLSIVDPKTPCTACHSPHEPIFLENRVSEARIHPLIHPCKDCHREPTIVSKPLPTGHVVTFQCQDCHAEIVDDFKTKSHRFFDCTVCHLFHQESEFSGRVFKNSSPRFCLMCHQARDFQDAREMPQLRSPEEHLASVAKTPEDRAKRCTACHQEQRIHSLGLKIHGLRAPGITP